jgi:hypothetical protein
LEQAGLGEHVLVDRDPLVGQRVDPRDLGGEGGVEQVGVSEPLPLGHDPDHFRIGQEVDGGKARGCRVAFRPSFYAVLDLVNRDGHDNLVVV